MSDIVAFIKARLDEDEQAARAVTDEHWDEDTGPGQNWNEFDEQVLDHIRRHDPARVLREVAAKRTILAEHELYPADGAGVGCGICAWSGRDGLLVASGPCKTLQALAAIWADHPDYDPAWVQ